MIWEVGFRKAIRLERGVVGRVVMYSIARLRSAWIRTPLCGCIGDSVRNRKSGECWSIIVTMATMEGLYIGPCLLSVSDEELEPFARRGGVWSMAKSCVLVRPRRGREIGKVRDRGDPIWTCLG